MSEESKPEPECGHCGRQGQKVTPTEAQCLVDGKVYKRPHKCDDFIEHVGGIPLNERMQDALEVRRQRKEKAADEKNKKFAEEMAEKDREHREELAKKESEHKDELAQKEREHTDKLQKEKMKFERKLWWQTVWWQIVLAIISGGIGFVVGRLTLP